MNAATAAWLPLPSSDCASPVSLEVKNHIGIRPPSAMAVIGRGGTPLAPSITVRSLLSARQNFSWSSRVSVIGLSNAGEVPMVYRECRDGPEKPAGAAEQVPLYGVSPPRGPWRGGVGRPPHPGGRGRDGAAEQAPLYRSCHRLMR